MNCPIFDITLLDKVIHSFDRSLNGFLSREEHNNTAGVKGYHH